MANEKTLLGSSSGAGCRGCLWASRRRSRSARGARPTRCGREWSSARERRRRRLGPSRLRVDPVERRRPADLVRDREERDADRALLLRDEVEALGPEVARGPGLWVAGEVAVVQVLDEARVARVGHVPDHDAADPLQPDERVRLLADDAEGEALRLRPLVVGARVEAVVLLVVGVELARDGGQLLERVARVEDELAGL